MKRAICLLLATLALAACEPPKAGEPVVTVDLNGENSEDGAPAVASAEGTEDTVSAVPSLGPSACSTTAFEGIDLTHCLANPADHVISAVYGPAGGDTAFGNLAAMAKAVNPQDIAFATNGGAFSDDLKPRGYLVVSGDRLSPLDQGTGDGNFYLEPNGVFFGTNGKWQILTTATFLRTISDRPQFGTQSGPMLLIDGDLGPSINPNGNSRAVRNAVGLDGQGRAHFVISNAPVSFGQLARFMRDELSVTDALFLDANSSSLWDPATGRMDKGRTGPILLISKKAAQ